ncbi:MAG: RNA 2',3'-cyclic phosphodiesterase [Paracoccaceae bacterium]|nr:RNA 2',3'-cyclic phosphodiesterase [Paracoccaceae bacterium]
MRVFVAIDLPDVAIAELVRLQNALAVGRLVPEENLHLTLSFLGEQSEEAVEAAHLALSGVRAAAFDLRLAGVGSFGKQVPQVIYADVAPCPALMDLAQRITRSLRTAGLMFEKRRFRPHVTLARLPRSMSGHEAATLPDKLARLAAFQGTPFRVHSFQLYQSTLSPSGARHETLASYPLEAGSA